jgi:hypothetical protein
LGCVEKVRPQVLSHRHLPERSGFCVNERAENPRAKVGFRGSWLYRRLAIFGTIGLEKAFFSKASYFVGLVRFRKVKRQRHNLKSKSASVRVSVGCARVTESLHGSSQYPRRLSPPVSVAPPNNRPNTQDLGQLLAVKQCSFCEGQITQGRRVRALCVFPPALFRTPPSYAFNGAVGVEADQKTAASR